MLGTGIRPGTAQRRPNEKPAEKVAKPIAVFSDNAKDNSDDEVEVVHEQAPSALAGNASLGATGEQGVLVKDILRAGAELKVGEQATDGRGRICSCRHFAYR